MYRKSLNHGYRKSDCTRGLIYLFWGEKLGFLRAGKAAFETVFHTNSTRREKHIQFLEKKKP